jgi:hypothetical protein
MIRVIEGGHRALGAGMVELQLEASLEELRDFD